MREVILNITCDMCADPVPEAEVLTLSGSYLGSRKRLVMDLCTSCANDYTRFEVEAQTTEAKTWKCDTCAKSYATQRGLNHHKTKAGHH